MSTYYCTRPSYATDECVARVMDRFVQRGVKPAAATGAGRRRAAPRQSTLESCAKVVTLRGFSCLSFTLEDLLGLKRELEKAGASAPELLDALRLLSSLVISTADLQASMLGRTVSALKRSTSAEVSRVATNLVAKWKEEVERMRVKDGHAPTAPTMRPPPARSLQEGTLDAELSSRRRGSGGRGSAASEALRVRLTASLLQGRDAGENGEASRLAIALEAAVPRTAQYGVCASALLAGVDVNESLRAALLSGWVTPAAVVILNERALRTANFLSGL